MTTAAASTTSLPYAVPTASPARRRLVGRLVLASRTGVVGGWIAVAAAVIFVTQLCNAMWAMGNPAPHHWDNADYLNLAYDDVWAARFGGPSPQHYTGWRGTWDSLLNRDHDRPPAYRVVSLPLELLGTRMLPALRSASLLVFWLTLAVVWRTVAVAVPGPAGWAAGAVAAMLVSLYLEVGWSVRVYGTEYTLYLAVATMLWCLVRAARATRPGWTWVWLGLSLGLGILSKMSFLFLAGPVGLVALGLSIGRRLPGLPVSRLLGAGAIGLAMAFPWYRYHLFTAYRYGSAMMQFDRHSLHKNGLRLLGAWLSLHTYEGLGSRAASVLLGLASAGVAVAGGRWWRRIEAQLPGVTRDTFDLSPAGWTVVLGLAQGVPLLAFQLLFSSSDNVRHMTPAYLPLTVAAAVAAGHSGVLSAWWSWPLLVAAAVPAVQQVGRDFIPMTTTPDDVWDWTPLYDICQAHGARFPFLGRVGNAGQFNEPAMVTPWASRGDWAVGEWLWRDEDGPFDWSKVEPKLADRTVVVTAPGFEAPADHGMLPDPLERDNANNAAFAEHMLREPGWLPPEKFAIGVVNRATVWVFVRRKV